MAERSPTRRWSSKPLTRRQVLGAGIALSPLLVRCASERQDATADGGAIEAPDAGTCLEPQGATPRDFRGFRGLAELPFFELDAEGRLRCVVCDLPPVVDFHTHLGFAYALAPAIDLLRRTEEVRYLVDCDGAEPPCALSLDGYLNACATPEMRKAMDDEMVAALTPSGSRASETHTIPNLLREMDSMGIRRAVVLPIALGLEQGDNATEQWFEAVGRAGARERLIMLGSVHPSDPKAVEKLRAHAALGVAGVKLHPTMQRFYPDAPEAMPIYEECQRLRLPVFFHAGRTGMEPAMTQPFAEMAHYVKPVKQFPDVQFVFGHSGAAMDWREALALAKEANNVWMEMAGQGIAELETIVGELGPERLLFGTDWPFYPEAATLAKVLILTRGDKAKRDLILNGNAERLLAMR